MKKLATLFLGAALLLGACSSGSATSSKPSKPSDTLTTTMGSPSGAAVGADQLEVAARAFINAFIAHDAATAHQLYTARCRKAVSEKNLTAFMKSTNDKYTGVKVTTYSAKISGSTAAVDYAMSDSSLSRSNQRWMVENGTWHNDEC